jgi:ketosteroid isomerase-like protein
VRSGGAWLLAALSLPVLAQVAPTTEQLPPLPEDLLRVLATENTLTPLPPTEPSARVVLDPAPQPPLPPLPELERAAEAAAAMEAEPERASENPIIAPVAADAEGEAVPSEVATEAAPESPATVTTAVDGAAPSAAVPVAVAEPEPDSGAASTSEPAAPAADVEPMPQASPSTPAVPAIASPLADTELAAEVDAAVAVVDEFHRTLREGWKDGVLMLLESDVVIVEQGYLERSREAYARGNLDSDMVFAASTQREVLQRQPQVHGNLAWVVTQARTTGQLAGQRVRLENAETMVLRRQAGTWRIMHIHWSAHTPDTE